MPRWLRYILIALGVVLTLMALFFAFLMHTYMTF